MIFFRSDRNRGVRRCVTRSRSDRSRRVASSGRNKPTTFNRKESDMSTKGAFVAALAVGLFAAAVPALAHAADTDKVRCEGVNECKGKGGCHSAANACAG